MVALRKESVDRNKTVKFELYFINQSLSARRAWIEIAVLELIPLTDPSLSARRAWIEINMSYNAAKSWVVALRKESVDRNKALPGFLIGSINSRSPQGERG